MTSSRPTTAANIRVVGQSYIPTLDGWRALAILPLLIAHYAPFISFLPRRMAGIGGQGVAVFFAISGFLICTLLLRERDLTGHIDLVGFYMRRAFRILPVAWVFLLVLAALRRTIHVADTNTDFLSAAFFLRNYIGDSSGSTQHYWSLAVEEHFYMILPVFLAIAGGRRTLKLCIVVSVSVCGWRLLHQLYPLWDTNMTIYRTDFRIDNLFDGALLAILLHEDKVRTRLQHFGPWMIYGIAIAGLCASRFIHSLALSRSFVALCLPILLVPGILFPTTIAARVLEVHWIRWVGRISYSLYIWQALFTGNQLHLLWGKHFWPLNMAAMLATSVASYYLMERPLIRLGHRLRDSVNRGRSDLE